GAVTVYFGGVPIAVWTGNNSVGTPVTNGAYFLKVDNVNSTGVDTSTTEQVTVSRTLYQLTVLIYNEAGEVVRHLYSYVSNPGQASVLSMSLSSSVIAPSETGSPGTPSQLDIVLGNGITIVWDGESDTGQFVQNGQYLVEVHNQDGTGGGAAIIEQVSVEDRNNSAGVGVVTAWPNLLRASNGPPVTTFHSDSAFSLTLRASIYTVAGEKVKDISGSPGSNEALWDATGLASGLYLAVVQETDSDGDLLSTQVVKVAIIH
ncbi:MAG TPA: hypothetical protein VK859_06550, partial [bacterium]|nr:hypothetical protein [bacterium]